jgi:hypothetical protein
MPNTTGQTLSTAGNIQPTQRGDGRGQGLTRKRVRTSTGRVRVEGDHADDTVTNLGREALAANATACAGRGQQAVMARLQVEDKQHSAGGAPRTCRRISDNGGDQATRSSARPEGGAG